MRGRKTTRGRSLGAAWVDDERESKEEEKPGEIGRAMDSRTAEVEQKVETKETADRYGRDQLA